MIKKLEPLYDEVEHLKRQGRQTLLTIEARKKRGEDTTEIWREQGSILNKLSAAYGELSHQHRVRGRLFIYLAVITAICAAFFTYDTIIDLIALLEYST